MGKKLPSDILRYTVLKIFEEGPSYGYEVVSSIEEVTDGYWSPSYGTIYPLIQRLEDQGLLKSLSEKEAKDQGLDNGDRNYFELTEKGKEEVTPDQETEARENFEELILGYLKIYENKYGKESLEELLENAL
ncbi:PadR family transcriptional regulator [Candidatus Nanohalovita haloferacivicina]|uniref:PadR family transcriptional regulator n=1 Tax=Candidatus Nanohalovita haloferacivicina TaxID=2978046 RepID=UPI00325FA7B5|nr:Transcriptional regulator, PadR family [Candidatus Nanohalobia archaeon BNXNv]